MTELEKAARECVFHELCVYCHKRVYTHCEYRHRTKEEPICKEGKVIHAKFIAGAEWKSKQSPWIDINDRSIIMPNDKPCLIRLENGAIVRDTEEWEDNYPMTMVTHWMPIPSFDDILEANKDVLERIKEKGD